MRAVRRVGTRAENAVAAELERRLPAGSIESIVFTEMGPAIGVHGGPETILVALQPIPRG